MHIPVQQQQKNQEILTFNSFSMYEEIRVFSIFYSQIENLSFHQGHAKILLFLLSDHVIWTLSET